MKYASSFDCDHQPKGSQVNEDYGTCICRKRLKKNQPLYCSDRCKWIGEKMNTPLGQRMDNTARAVRFFGKIWDKDHD